jgi:hippurate hydrolase
MKDRWHLQEGIERMARAAAQGARAPEPIVKVDAEQYTPVTVNDPALTRRLVALFQQVLGTAQVAEVSPRMVSDDFGRYGREGIPSLIYFLGVFSPERVAEAERPGGQPLPSNHSPLYCPVLEPTLKTGLLTMSMAVLNLLGRPPEVAARR